MSATRPRPPRAEPWASSSTGSPLAVELERLLDRMGLELAVARDAIRYRELRDALEAIECLSGYLGAALEELRTERRRERERCFACVHPSVGLADHRGRVKPACKQHGGKGHRP